MIILLSFLVVIGSVSHLGSNACERISPLMRHVVERLKYDAHPMFDKRMKVSLTVKNASQSYYLMNHFDVNDEVTFRLDDSSGSPWSTTPNENNIVNANRDEASHNTFKEVAHTRKTSDDLEHTYKKSLPQLITGMSKVHEAYSFTYMVWIAALLTGSAVILFIWLKTQLKATKTAVQMTKGNISIATSIFKSPLMQMAILPMSGWVVKFVFTGWYLFCLLLICESAKGIQVMKFQEDGVASNTTLADYPTPLDRNKKFTTVTMCARFKIFFLHSRGNLFKLMDTVTNREAMLKGEIWVERVRPVFAHTWNFQVLDTNLWAFRWYHLCFTYDQAQTLIQTFLDGELKRSQVYDIKNPIHGNYFNLGQGDLASESFSGELTQVNVWDRILDPEEIHSMAKCESDPQGNYISWNVEWKLQDITSYDVSLGSLCNQEIGATYFWFPNIGDAMAQYICEALGTHLPTARTEQEKDELLTLGQESFSSESPYANCHFKLWTALNDKDDEGQWRYAYNNELAETIYWSPGEPNGIVYENCGLISYRGIDDVDCRTNIRCALCTFTELKRFSFLGICEPELRNVYFVAYKEGEDDLIFRGYGKYHIRLENGTWVWYDVVGNVMIARMEVMEPNYPMGRRVWKLEQEVCGQEPGGLRPLLLTPCSEQEFTCNNAACIPLSSRCDLRYDCKDKSDEIDCNPIAFPEDYQQHLPPRPNEEEDNSLPIFLEVTIDALDVRTLLMTTEVTYMVRMIWKENRVNYLNAKENNTLNILSYTTFKDLWTPMVDFVNTDGNYHTETDKEATMYINRLRKPNKRDEAAPAEVEVFFGEFNTVSIQRKYTTVFTCSFDLVLYPFDVQQCYLHLSLTSAPRTFLYFKQENSSVTFSTEPKLLEYGVGDLSIVMDNTKFYSEAKIIIPLRRRWGYAILNIYTPSLVLLIVSYVTLYFRPAIFDVRMMSALTAQLVIATFFSQVSSTLPKTSYFKMVDVWLLFCIGITFLVIIFHAIVDTLINDPDFNSKNGGINKVFRVLPHGHDPASAKNSDTADPKHRGKQMVLATKVVTLGIFVIFNLIYWGQIMLSS